MRIPGFTAEASLKVGSYYKIRLAKTGDSNYETVYPAGWPDILTKDPIHRGISRVLSPCPPGWLLTGTPPGNYECSCIVPPEYYPTCPPGSRGQITVGRFGCYTP